MAVPKGRGVYAVECLDRIKVGWCSDLPARVASFKLHLPAPPVLRWAFTLADRSHETELHQRLEEWRLYRDWFALTPDTEIELEDFAQQWEQRRASKASFPHVISLSEFAQFAGVSPRTVYRWVKKGRLQATKVGRNYRVSVRQLMVNFPSVYETIHDVISPQLGRAMQFVDD